MDNQHRARGAKGSRRNGVVAYDPAFVIQHDQNASRVVVADLGRGKSFTIRDLLEKDNTNGESLAGP